MGAWIICGTRASQAGVIPAKAGIHSASPLKAQFTDWVPAFAGTTGASEGD